MPNAPFEPAAEMRAFAATLRQMFEALRQEGFTEQQALTIVGQVIASNNGDDQ